MNPAHLEYETLADLAEGLLDGDLAASAAEHLAGCDECQHRSSELTEVSRLLAESPVPPMPVELTARINAALAAESASTAAVPSLPARRGRRNRWMILSAAAAGIVIAGGGAVVGGSMITSSMISSEASKAESGPISDRRDQTTYGLKPFPAPSPSDGSGSGAAAQAGGYPVTMTGTDYRNSTLGSQITTVLRRGEPPVTQSPSSRLSGCVNRIAAARTPLLVDVARYESRPATIIVLPGTGPDHQRSHLDVWVVGPNCSAASSDLLTHVRV